MTISLVSDAFPPPSFEPKSEQQRAATRPVTLYHAPMSICAQQVRLALEEKGVTWRSHLVNLAGMEHLNPWYMQINPRGVVPTLMDDERIVIDSVTILHYIDKNFIGPKLTPDGVGEQRTMHEWLALNEEFPITDLTFGNLAGLFGRVQRAKLHN